jgi:cytochrome P450
MILLDPALIRQFYVDKERYYIKNQDFVRNIKRLLGSGMAFSEGQVWKHKRTIISKVFNYNFLLQLLPTVTAIVNDVLARLPVGEVLILYSNRSTST